MRRVIALILPLCASVPRILAAQPGTPLPEADVRREERLFENTRDARYMEQNCVDTTFAGWDGFPVKRCTYSVRERGGGSKTATVVLLDATPRQLARWVVQACAEARRTTAAACTGKLRRRIIEQSGAQFPVAGIVLEDMEGDGTQNLFVFRDGVTVTVDGVSNGSAGPVTADVIRRSLTSPVVRTGKFARVASTTREEYRANGGTVDAGTSTNRKLAWLGVVRTLYQQAFRSDRNELLVAWLRAN
ncbi:MAG TPA: hypothetical protein VFJ16_11150 [Longimicrobium sp.]|nr:hypothetical protein [Longimicrobium sp.]